MTNVYLPHKTPSPWRPRFIVGLFIVAVIYLVAATWRVR
jgi:hypothetical protein